MYHSITFAESIDKSGNLINAFNTWDTFHLIPTVKPAIAPASTTKEYAENQDATGNKDLTEALTGEVIYGTREGTLEFYMANGYWHGDPFLSETRWKFLKDSIAAKIHGKALKMVLEDDPNYYYEGRFSFTSFASQKDWSKVLIGYQLGPFRYRINESDDMYRQIWDKFNFLTDYDYSGLKAASGRVGIL